MFEKALIQVSCYDSSFYVQKGEILAEVDFDPTPVPHCSGKVFLLRYNFEDDILINI